MERGESRRLTRSESAAEWTVQETLILINSIQSIQSDWSHTLASFQKWQLVVHHCAALDVTRTFHQCKRKWAHLLAQFKSIKPFQQAYWAFDAPKRRELGLPDAFSAEVFQAVDCWFETGKGGFDDDEEEVGMCDLRELLSEKGFKKQRKRAVPQKRKIDKRINPWRHVIVRKVSNDQDHLDGLIDPSRSKIAVKVNSAADSIKNCSDDNVELPNTRAVGKVKLDPSNVKVDEHSIASNLLENMEMINSVLQGNLGEEDFDSKVATQIDIARLQGDKLIHHLGKFSNTLEQLCNIFQQCN
ncbi:hypothetical protein Leryth_020795 [Lithospermum erythrorhizon]|nr:hypothetical protein Leryth_020795 [Lithospermum erythrorhizon]